MPIRRPAVMQRLIASLADMRQGHEARHRPSGCEYSIASHLGDLDGATWDAAAAGSSLFLQRRYLGILDHESPANVSHRFVLASRARRPVAAMVFQLVDIAGDGMGAQRLRGTGRLAAKGLHVRVLVSGNLLTWGAHALAIAPDADAELAWSALGEAMYRIRRGEELAGAPAVQVVKDLPAAIRPQPLRLLGYRPVATDPDMVLTLDPRWKSWEGYLTALAAKYRKQARDCTAAVAAAGIRCEPVSDVAAISEAMHGLYLQVQARATIRPIAVGAGYLAGLSRSLGEDFRCSALWRGAELVGFITVIRDGETAIGYHVGFDTAANDEAPIYFRLLYECVAMAIGLGCRRLSLGRTALEPKARLGARPEPMVVWGRHRLQALNVLLRPWLGLLPHHEAPERSPFKASS